jgi:hypothetical protein
MNYESFKITTLPGFLHLRIVQSRFFTVTNLIRAEVTGRANKCTFAAHKNIS